MSNHLSPAHLSRIDAAREGNGRFGSWMSSEDASVTLPAPAPPMGLQELKDLHLRSARAARAAEMNERLSGIAIAAQHVLADYPDAESIVLVGDGDGGTGFVQALNQEGEVLGSYDMDAGGTPEWSAAHEWLSHLEDDSPRAAWKAYAPHAAPWQIDLAPAAAWSPEPTGDDLAA